MADQGLEFIVIGAQKSGTTTLHAHMSEHPSIYMPPDKEVPHFSHDHRYEQGWTPYFEQTFGAAPTGAVRGKATPHYMAGAPYARTRSYDPATITDVVPSRIHAQLPGVRIIAILRDPIARCVSHYRMLRMQGREPRECAVAIRELLEPESLATSRAGPTETNSYITWSEYGRILRPYYERFGQDHILVVGTRDLERDPAEVMRRIFSFVGVGEDFTPPKLGERYRVGADRTIVPVDPFALEARARRSGFARRAWRCLPAAKRDAVARAFKRSAYQFVLWNRRPATETTTNLPTDLRSALQDHYRSDAEILTALTGQPVPW